ncbi:MAG: ACT domain-containing protein [Deltaproteobacteria bacterium]|nr:ACT domain-containing protein [Deltaproteobacteria bacterium]
MESSSPLEDNRLGPSVCAPLAQQRLNLTFFTHVAGDREVLCTASHNGEAALTLLQSQADPAASLALQPGTSILAVYPHDKRPEVIGTFIRSLARARVVIHGLASSPSAITAVLSSSRIKPAVEQLFEHFTFPGYASPQEFFSAQAPPKEYLEKVVATYQEKVTKVYWIIPQSDLDLWGIHIATADILAGFAAALMEMGELGLAIPFLVALPGLGGQEFILSFSTARRQPGGADQGKEIRRVLKSHLPDLQPMRLTPVAGIFLHGPHFGDRYGIAHTLVTALAQAHISLLALSCTISTISLIIRQHELAAAQVILGNTFAAPVECAPAAARG